MASVKTSTFTTSDGTKVSITVNGEEFRIEGRRPEPILSQPVDLWSLRQELDSVKMMIVGWGMGIIAFIVIAAIFVLIVR